MNTHRSLAGLLCVALLSSCDAFDKTAVQQIAGPTPTTARIKFHNFAPGAVGVNFFANDVKMTAVSTTNCTPLPTAEPARGTCLAAGNETATGSAYPAVASGELYVAVPPGAYTFTSKVAAQTAVVSTIDQTIEDGKYYSFFMSGIYNTTARTADAFVVEDPIPTTLDFAVAHVRLVNAVSNATGDLTLYAISTATTTPPPTEVTVGTAVAYKGAGTFVAVPAGIYNLRVRATGAGTDLITRLAVSLVGGRVYTITARGNTATATTLGLDFTQNQR
jgi:hypothetical protein